MNEPTDQPPPPHRRSPLSWVLMTASLALVAGLLSLLVYRVTQGNPGKGLVASIHDGKKPMAPEFRLKVLWGHTETWDTRARQALLDDQVSLSELRGEPVVLNFWASWCVPCGREAPRLAASAKAHRGEVVFLGLDVGKGEHHAVGLDPVGKRLHDAPLPNSGPKLKALFDKLAAHGPLLVPRPADTVLPGDR